MITGVRQVGKTYSIRASGKQSFNSFIEVNFLENIPARTLFENAKNSKDLLLRLSALVDSPLIPGKTLIFFDEVQECKEIVTAIKFLVEEGSFRYILSGSLLGVDLKDIRSIPVGYMDIIEMYPLDFEEFALANQVSSTVLEALRKSFTDKVAVDPVIHEKMMDLFRLYLIVGGMPVAVQTYLSTNNLKEVMREQRSILSLYKKDIANYDSENKLYLEDIFDLIPSELNSKNKRFILKKLNENFKYSRYANSFLWLKDAGVALPTFCVKEPTVPLLLSKCSNLFKLFLCDVGLLSSMYMDNIQLKSLIKKKTSILVLFMRMLLLRNSRRMVLTFIISTVKNKERLIFSLREKEQSSRLKSSQAKNSQNIRRWIIYCQFQIMLFQKLSYFTMTMSDKMERSCIIPCIC
ncbi:MAG: ATP-binding protein [Sphaerochaeta sp.]